jgi:hypothetical protein
MQLGSVAGGPVEPHARLTAHALANESAYGNSWGGLKYHSTFTSNCLTPQPPEKCAITTIEQSSGGSGFGVNCHFRMTFPKKYISSVVYEVAIGESSSSAPVISMDAAGFKAYVCKQIEDQMNNYTSGAANLGKTSSETSAYLVKLKDNTAWGKVVFLLKKEDGAYKKLTLTEALTAFKAGNTPDDFAYVDGAGFKLIERMELIFSGQTISEVSGTGLLEICRNKLSKENYKHVLKGAGGIQTHNILNGNTLTQTVGEMHTFSQTHKAVNLVVPTNFPANFNKQLIFPTIDANPNLLNHKISKGTYESIVTRRAKLFACVPPDESTLYTENTRLCFPIKNDQTVIKNSGISRNALTAYTVEYPLEYKDSLDKEFQSFGAYVVKENSVPIMAKTVNLNAVSLSGIVTDTIVYLEPAGKNSSNNPCGNVLLGTPEQTEHELIHNNDNVITLPESDKPICYLLPTYKEHRFKPIDKTVANFSSNTVIESDNINVTQKTMAAIKHNPVTFDGYCMKFDLPPHPTSCVPAGGVPINQSPNVTFTFIISDDYMKLRSKKEDNGNTPILITLTTCFIEFKMAGDNMITRD